MSPAFALIKGVLGKVHPLVWLIVAALIWGAFQRHRAASAEKVHTQAVAAAAAEREAALLADAAETSRRLTAQKGITDEARARAAALASDADRARAAADRLRAQLAAVKADAGASHPAAADGSPADRIPDVLAQCVERYRSVAASADRAITAGQTCAAAYDALTSK